ncbi:NAD(P)H-hydrate dehydratase [Paucibacter sp. KCTC 42545]|uniref:NAD(P)H-hydrate dehydratase n=1 Tax=Paucibacter sp. KCTC 42545 TaxID=1768242 RepID=UPI001E6380F5|nr:NAD(P)H-hydrate dehydratase [Paucibacter sp. KCTC 42545]
MIHLSKPPHTLPLFMAASARAMEARALAQQASPSLMERAGLGLAKLALALQPDAARSFWVVCGPGNNGGDGLVAARLLHAHGRRVRVSLIPSPKHTPADAQMALQAAQAAGVPITQDLTPPDNIGLAIDALLGLGTDRAPSGAIATAIQALNQLSAPVLAVDLPSGLAPDSGSCHDDLVVQAQHTLCLLSLKPGLFTGAGRACCGEIWFDGLGVAPDEPDARLIGLDCLRDWARPASHMQHKGSQGDVLAIGGAPGLRGALRLAARAALAAGAGRVYACPLYPTRETAPLNELDTQAPELMQLSLSRLGEPSAWAGRTVLCGCGGGQEVAATLPTVLTQAERLVLDADALNAIAADPTLQSQLQQRAARQQATLLTPHPLEAARLLGCDTKSIQADRLNAAQQLADRFESCVVLKGSGTVITAPSRTQQTPLINSSGSAALATAGTGDVLAGWLAGLWAQAPQQDPQALAAAAVHWHGLAGQSQALGPLRAGALVERMHAMRSSFA